MNRNLLSLLGLSLLFNLTACGPNSNSTSALHEVENQKKGVMLIGMGGYLSCPDGNVYGATHVEKMKDIERAVLAQGREVKKIFSCYDSSSADPSNLVIHFALTDGQPQNNNIWYFMEQVANEVNSHPELDVYMIGHSHGGWLSMTLLKSKPFNRNIKGYFSIDPISRVDCSPASFAQNTIGSIFGSTDQSKNGCLRFPYDIGDFDNIRRRVGFWKNFYQDNSPTLHSGAVNQAENVRKDYGFDGGYDPNASAHVKIWSDWSVWGEFKWLIENGY